MIDALLARFGYFKRTWDVRSGHRDADAIAKAHRWQAFYNEPEGIGQMIETIRKAYFAKVGSIKPGDTDTLQALGMADVIARELDAAVKAIIDTGEMERQANEHAARIAALPEAMRRRL